MALAGREKAMGFVWFVIAGVLTASVLWIVYDDTITRRTWKDYAAEWQNLETERLTKAITAEEAKIDKNELKKIRLEREEAEKLLDSDEFEQAVEELKNDKNEYDDARTQLQFAKADLDEVYYLWKHAQQTGEPFEDYKNRYEELNKGVQELTKLEGEWEKKYNLAKEKVDSYEGKLKDLQARENALYEKIVPLKRQLEAVQGRGAPIEQVVLDDLGRVGPVVWGTVDRCTTCHVPIMTPGYEKGKNPFKTHPDLEKIFNAHPYDSYGCVSCHGGQGRATQIKGQPLQSGDYVHGFEKHWLNPLLQGDYVESSCNKCHMQQFSLDMAPVYSQGKRLFVNYGCINCHKVEGLEWAPKIGPDLTKIKEKVYPEWMFAWAKKPTDYLPKTRMPQPPWHDDKDIVKAMAYILAKSEPFNFNFGEFPGGDAAQGEATVNKVGCIACHSFGGKGGDVAPALDRIAEKTTGKWIYNWIQNPKNWSTHARMPSLRLSPEEARNVTAFLLTKGNPPAPDEKLRAALLEEGNIKEGFGVINTYGCYACHEIRGFENASRPSVELTNFARKDVHELAFGDAKIPETWEAWTLAKLENPQVFLDERSTSTMPKPNITDEQRHALVVFLRGQAPEELPEKYLAFDKDVEAGRRLVNWYNCQACHVIEGEGGTVAQFVEDPNFAPPDLASAGARLQTNWMYHFLKNPETYPKIRPWLNLRMPTFGFTDEEADDLVRYFKIIAFVNTLLEEKISGKISSENLEAGKTLIGNENFQCASCHIIGNQIPLAGPTVWAPDLAYGHHRLRPEWINEWIRDPAKLIQGIRMPGYYPEKGSGPKTILGGDDEKQIQAIVDYLMYLGQGGSIVSQEKQQVSRDPAQP